jgi:DNA polymerase family A/3'-5' exonuclease
MSIQKETFRDQFDRQLVPKTSLAKFSLKDGYKIVPKVSDTWNKAEEKLLIIVETVDWSDIRADELLNNEIDQKRGFFLNSMHTVLPELVQRSYDAAVSISSGKSRQKVKHGISVGVLNFNAAKSRHLDTIEQVTFGKKFASRMLSIIQELKPTLILCCGNNPHYNLLRACSLEPAQWEYVRMGKVRDLEYRGLKFRLVHTLDIEPLYNPNTKKDLDAEMDDRSDKFSKADLLFLASRHVTNLFLGYQANSIAEVAPRVRLVDTLSKFDSLYSKLLEADEFALDTEDRSLGVYNNVLYIVQVALSSKAGYIIPVRHPDTPFKESEIKYIEGKLKSLLDGSAAPKRRKTIVTMNGSFDLKVLRAQLGIYVIPHLIWEITAGEACLDENVGLLSKSENKVLVGTSYQLCAFGGLRNICVYYDNDFYYTAPFSKEDRGNIGAVPLTNTSMLEYCAMDVQTLIAIKEQQLERANTTYVRPKFDGPMISYKELYERLVVRQLSNTVQAISYMEQYGSPLDLEYLESLKEKGSTLRNQIAETARELRELPEVKKVNYLLNESVGRTIKGIFGGSLTQNVFSIRKKAHLEKLFFDVLKLEPLRLTDTGERAIDKAFIQFYEYDHVPVKIYGSYVKAFKLFSTYVVGWNKKIAEGLDSKLDRCLRASFVFFQIVTGRLASKSPNLQQIPSRGPVAKILKRAFAAPKGMLSINYDLSSHEVRMWGIIAGDENICNAYKYGQELRRQWIQAPSPELAEAIKIKGDIHVQNYNRFFGHYPLDSNGKIDKAKRTAFKQITFGQIYSKSPATLGEDLKKETLADIDAAIRSVKAEIKELEATKKLT